MIHRLVEKEYEIIKKIPGWFSIEDASIVYELINKNKKNGEVVEVGSFLGKSCRFISNFTNVTCIDPWIAGEKIKQKLLHFGFNIEINKSFYDAFNHFAIENNKFKDRIKIIKDFDNNVYENWKGDKIRFLFLDHDHTYKAVLSSLLGWKKHMCKYGKILIHDGNWKNVWSGIVDSKINVCRMIKTSAYKPIVCSWDKIKYD